MYRSRGCLVNLSSVEVRALDLGTRPLGVNYDI